MARILVIAPNKGLFPPEGGGMIRRFNLIRELAKQHEVHLVVRGDSNNFNVPRDGYEFPKKVRTYSANSNGAQAYSFDILPRKFSNAIRYRWLVRSLRGPADSTVLETEAIIRSLLKTHDFDVVMFGDLSSMLSAPLIARLSPQSLRLLNADNVDHHLLGQELSGNALGDAERLKLQADYCRIRNLECNLAKYVHLVFTCSNYDRDALQTLNGDAITVITAPNGVDTAARSFDDRVSKSATREIIFCATLTYQPNREGLVWFHEHVWPLILARYSDARLTVVGWGGEREQFSRLCVDPTVNFVGEVSNSIPYYHAAGVTVVPLRMGSGTRLKILDAMSLGNPIVSTKIGADGIGAINGEHLLLADEPSRFADSVVGLLSDSYLFHELRYAARRFVEEAFDWRIIGRTVNEAIDKFTRQFQN